MTVSVGEGALGDLQVELRRAATAMRDIDVAGPLDGVGPALPASQTAGAASVLAVRLGAGVQVLAERADALADVAQDTAASYRATDDAAAGNLQGVQ